MPHAFAEIAFTPEVKAAQQRDGSRAGYARSFEGDGEPFNDRLGPTEVDFLAKLRSFYLATVSETGWPYVQHRGGPAGFVQVLDEQNIAFADYAGNRQLISVGNLAGNPRVALIAVDYTKRVRLKLLGTMAVQPLADDKALAARLMTPGPRARPQRAMVIRLEGFDWNCPQHIPLRLDADDVQRALDQRDARIAELESRLVVLARQAKG
ncbi:MAG: pyridoxamine 5'-phosphate oxidase family protein [Rhodospirillales bacterium]|nr:MAG: pyridoxamine 5'-phosphate oxidase family protein [Rhodospirillales bacterium]